MSEWRPTQQIIKNLPKTLTKFTHAIFDEFVTMGISFIYFEKSEN